MLVTQNKLLSKCLTRISDPLFFCLNCLPDAYIYQQNSEKYRLKNNLLPQGIIRFQITILIL